jgi:hypothetical protein
MLDLDYFGPDISKRQPQLNQPSVQYTHTYAVKAKCKKLKLKKQKTNDCSYNQVK